MYGFRKVGQEAHTVCFAHPSFYRGGKKAIGSIKRKMPKREVDTKADDKVNKELQETIGRFSERIEELEKRDRDCEWLKAECQKLQ